MNDAYAIVGEIWARFLAGDRANCERDIIALLVSHDIRVRQKDGELRQWTLSKPTSREQRFMIGLRYEKLDQTATEDLFLVAPGCRIKHLKKQNIENDWPEYLNTHKQPIVRFTFPDVLFPITTVNTISAPRPPFV